MKPVGLSCIRTTCDAYPAAEIPQVRVPEVMTSRGVKLIAMIAADLDLGSPGDGPA